MHKKRRSATLRLTRSYAANGTAGKKGRSGRTRDGRTSEPHFETHGRTCTKLTQTCTQRKVLTLRVSQSVIMIIIIIMGRSSLSMLIHGVNPLREPEATFPPVFKDVSQSVFDIARVSQSVSAQNRPRFANLQPSSPRPAAADTIRPIPDEVAERTKAHGSGPCSKERGFEPHPRH